MYIRRFCITIFLCINSLYLFSQEYKYEIGGHISAQHYFGDISRRGLISPWHIGSGLDFRYNYNFRLALSSSLGIEGLRGSIKWADNTFPSHKGINHFSRYITDLSILGEYNFYPYSDKYKYLGTQKFTPFIGLGMGLFVGKAETLQYLPYVQCALGIKYKLTNRLNLAVYYQIKYTAYDNLDVTNNRTRWLSNPMNIKMNFPKGGDGIGLLSISLTYDIGMRKVSDCH